jgi:class IV lanthipeptide synthase
LLERTPSTTARLVEDPNQIWIHVDFPERTVPPRGWKLHVSATPWSAHDVLDACLPVLVDAHIPFKVPATIERLIELNEGAGGLSQAGKFLTAYPSDADSSVDLARRLDDATRGLRGPRVLNERSLSPSSLVHYRYGDYVEEVASNPIQTPPDPFVASGLLDEPQTKLIAGRYLITATLHRSVRGAVYLAVDASEARSCVVKRAWRDAIVTPDGRDARDRLRQEAELLEMLADDPHFPTVIDVLTEEDDLFVAMDYVEGPTFAERVSALYSEGSPPHEAQIVTWGKDLVSALTSLHTNGFVHRDLNPINLIAGNRLTLIDLELTQRIGTQTASFGAGTIGYVSANQQSGGPARVSDDIYGIGALLVFAATGADPDPGTLTAVAIAARAARRGVDLSPELAGIIAGCLDQDRTWTSLHDIAAALTSVQAPGIPS